MVDGIKWYLSFYPNGSKIARAGFPNVYLQLASLPATNLSVSIRHSQGLNGDYRMRNQRFANVLGIDKTGSGMTMKGTYSTTDLSGLNNLLVVAEIFTLDIYQNGHVIALNPHKNTQTQVLKVHSFGIKQFDWELEDMIMDCVKDTETGQMKYE